MIGVASLAIALSLTGEAKITTKPFEGELLVFNASRCNGGFQSQWRSTNGKVITEETLNLDGDQWTRYKLQQNLINRTVLAIKARDSIRITIRNGADRRQITIPYSGEILTGPLLVEFLGFRIKDIRDRVLTEFEYLVAEQGIILRLRARLEGEPSSETTSVRVEAASFFLRAFAPNVLLVYNNEGLLRSTTGRLLPILSNGGNPKSVDGELRVKHTSGNCAPVRLIDLPISATD